MPVGKEHLYMVTGTNPLGLLDPLAKRGRGHLALRGNQDRQGAVERRGVGQYHASLLRTGDDKLLMLDEAGNLVLVDPNAKEYQELARAKVAGAPSGPTRH